MTGSAQSGAFLPRTESRISLGSRRATYRSCSVDGGTAMGERSAEGEAHAGAKMIEKPAVMLTAVAAGLVVLGLAAADAARAQTAAADRNTDAALSARAQ